MQYLTSRSGNYYFIRRVPLFASEYDSRKIVRVALGTDSLKQAKKLAAIQNATIEEYWHKLVKSGTKHHHDKFQEVVERAKMLGFDYRPVQELAAGPIEELVKRLLFVATNNKAPQVEAVLGGIPKPKITLSEALAKFWQLSKEQVLDKTALQRKKWENPKKRAMQNFINCVGDKPLQEVSRADALKFKDWWIGRIEKEDLGLNGANKNFNDLRVIIKLVSRNYQLNIDVEHIFGELNFEEDKDTTKCSFPTAFIRNQLLNPTRLDGMNPLYQAIMMAIAETGAGVTELLAINTDEIFLEDDIPYVAIVKRKKNGLKTKHRRRNIPLVGYALDAFKRFPDGFKPHVNNPDSVSSGIGKYLKENNLLPSEKHTLNSLRHSFQDRLLRADAPDRVQADLMGHRFKRQAYGEGSTLEHKAEWLRKIQLKGRAISN